MKFSHTIYCGVFLLINVIVATAQSNTGISQWLTNNDRSQLFRLQPKNIAFTTTAGSQTVIEVNAAKTFQSIDGFGFALTGGSAQHIIHMSQSARTALLKELFSTDGKNIGISYLRLSIGASDLNDHVFSYDDLPAGQIDTALQLFNL